MSLVAGWLKDLAKLKGLNERPMGRPLSCYEVIYINEQFGVQAYVSEAIRVSGIAVSVLPAVNPNHPEFESLYQKYCQGQENSPGWPVMNKYYRLYDGFLKWHDLLVKLAYDLGFNISFLNPSEMKEETSAYHLEVRTESNIQPGSSLERLIVGGIYAYYFDRYQKTLLPL